MGTKAQESRKQLLLIHAGTVDQLIELRRKANELRNAERNGLTNDQRNHLGEVEANVTAAIAMRPKIVRSMLDRHVRAFLASDEGTMAYQSSVFAEKGKKFVYTDYLDVIAAYVREITHYIVFALDVHESLNRVMLTGRM